MTESAPLRGPVVIAAAERATIGVIVAVPSGEEWTVEFSNARSRELFGAGLKRLPDDLAVGAEHRAAILTWLRSGQPARLVLPGVTGGSGATQAVRIVASRTDVGGRPAAAFFVFGDAAPRTERALAQSEERFRLLLDTAPDAIVLGTRGRFSYANPAFVRLLGYDSMAEALQRPMRDHLHPDDRPIARQVADALAQDRGLQQVGRLRCLRKDGGVVEFGVQGLTIDWAGEVAFLGIGTDLSERRRVQAQLIQADRLASMGTLAAGVAHEINNPLAYVMLNLQYVMRELSRFDGSTARLSVLLERLAEAEHGARRVSTIVGDLRAFAQPEKIDRGPVNVARAVSRAAKVAGSQLRHRARLIESYAPTSQVVGSEARLEQVFLNLLINAAQAVQQGGPEENEISVVVRPEGDDVIVEVKDTGVGIPRENLDRVFDPFFTTKPRGVGTGLGLPICRSIVGSHGGEITVESAVGAGTTFRVSLPALVTEAVSEPAASSAPSEAPPGKGVRAHLLVVDDEPLVAEMLRRALSEAHDVTVATEAQTALDYILSGESFDLVFCDVLMPRMSGMDLYARLAAERPGFEERIVFMTGGAFTERAAQFLATIPNRQLAKPFDLRTLEDLVLRAMRAGPH